MVRADLFGALQLTSESCRLSLPEDLREPMPKDESEELSERLSIC
jgi:hypothetical protein